MKKIAKKILLVLLTLIGVLIGILLTLSIVYKDSAHERLLKYVNQEFEGKIHFNEFSFSYLRRFPRIFIELKDVSVLDNNYEVVKIGKLEVLLNLESIWSKKINIEKLLISDAMLSAEVDSLGNKHRILASERKATERKQSSLILESRNIKITNSKVYFGNMIKGNRTYLTINSANFRLATQDSLLILTGQLDGFLDTLVSNKTVLFDNQPIKVVNAEIRINQLTGEKEVVKGEIRANTLKLTPHLKMIPKDDGQLIELKITAEDNFDTFLELFHFHTGFDFSQVNPGAKLVMSYNQKGFVNAFLRPFSKLDFKIIDAEFTSEVLPFPLKIGEISGNYNNGEKHSSETVELVIDTIHAAVNQSYINGRFKLKNLKDPVVDAHLVSFLDLSNLIEESKTFSLVGTIDFDLVLNGKISELKKQNRLGKHTAKGQVNVHDLKLLLKDQDININMVNASTILNNQFVEVTNLIGAFNKSAFHFKGNIENWDHYLFDENEQLAGKFELNFDELDLTKMNFGQSKKNKENSSFSLPLTLMNIEISVNGKKVKTDFGLIEKLKLDCLLSENKVKISSLGFRFQEGNVNGSGDVAFGKTGILAANAFLKGRFKDLNLDFSNHKKDTSKVKKPAFQLPEYLTAEVDLQVDKGNIAQIPVKNLVFQAKMKQNEVSVSKFSVDAFDGRSTANGRVKLDSTGISGITMNVGMSFKRLDLENLMSHFPGSKTAKSNKNALDYPQQMDVTIDLSAAGVIYKDASISHLKTNIRATENQIHIAGFSTDFPFGNLSMDIKVNDFKNDKINFEGTANLTIDSLDVDKYLELEAFGLPDPENFINENDNTKEKKSFAVLPQNINFKLKVKANHLSYKNAGIKNLDLAIDYQDKRIDLNRLKFRFAGGSADINGYMLKDQPKSYPGYFYSKVDSID